jgi:fatty acid desaturase
MEHPHDLVGAIPERLDPRDVRRLSVLAPARAIAAITVEWSILALAIAVGTLVDAWPVTLLAIVVIGARQHALTVIAHDAAHFRLLPHRQLNDWVGNVLLAWPMFISVQGFRHYHGDHHRHLNREGDGNRALWNTHDAEGRFTWEWRYPKTPLLYALKLARRVFLLTGLFWIVRGLIGGFMFGVSLLGHVVRLLLWAAVAWLLTVFDAWPEFFLYWVVPYCTWHIAAQYIRLTCEHSAIQSEDPRYADTRTTIPGWIGRFLVLPRNIGYHIEHHWYPSVPFYRLPELHALLAQRPGFRAHAHCERSILDSLRQCITPSIRELTGGEETPERKFNHEL